jgi:hypothetical protein
MPFLVQTRVNGQLHHAIEHTEPNRLHERLGTESARLEISKTVAGGGLDALVRLYFPEAHQDGA